MSIRSLISTAGSLAIVAGAPMTLSAQNTRADFEADKAFVSQVAASNLLEVRLGQTAQTKAQALRVQEFGAKMVDDHTRSQQQWMALASQYRVSFNARLSPEQEQQLERLRNLSGRDFEVEYMDQMVQNHQNGLTLLTTQGRAARSAGTRDLVERSIPMIQEHLTLATQIRRELGGAAVAANRPDTQAAAGAPTPWQRVKPDPKRPPQDANQNANQQQKGNAANAGRGTGNIEKDTEFIRDKKTHDFLEQRLGELAIRRARNPQVKDYARRVRADHAAMEKQWVGLAISNGLTIRPGMGKNHRERLEQLEKTSDREFDREYMTREVKTHEWYLNHLAKDGRRANSSAVRELVERVFNTEMNHYNLAKRVGAQVDADTSSKLKAATVR